MANPRFYGTNNNAGNVWQNAMYNNSEGGISTASINQGKDPFKSANLKKGDIKMVDDAANHVGVDRNEFRKFIHEMKAGLGMRANQNFSYKELVELTEELADMMK